MRRDGKRPLGQSAGGGGTIVVVIAVVGALNGVIIAFLASLAR
jgi:hypothetical protein